LNGRIPVNVAREFRKEKLPMNTMGRNTIGGELLRGYVERIERINEEIKALGKDKAVVMAEAKAANLIPAGVNFIVKKRKMKPSERAEAESLQDMYMHAMGMAVDNPLFRAVGLMKVDITARESVIEAMKQFVPVNGTIEVEAGGGPKVRLTRDKEGNVAVTEIVEKPAESRSPPSKGNPARAPKPDAPDVDADGAEQLGGAAFTKDVPIIDNPFPFGDPRRARWDQGWRKKSGTDGMGPDD
jgi:uncharacterized protein (UPF0335 family)